MKRAIAAGASLLVSVAFAPTLLATQAEALAIDAAALGTAPDQAAGSCWEIKQRRPSAPSGAYWLLTPTMAAPARFYCDQTTDGGGWVLVGKGRDGWTTEYAGKGDPAALQSPDTVPMSSVTHQLSSPAIDQLLDGGRVDALGEGVRIRRATTRDGSSWQEVRLRFSSKSRWSWTFGAEHGLIGWQFDSLPGWGGSSESFGSGQTYTRMVNSTNAAKKYRIGFGYGTSVVGHTDSASFLWAATNGAASALPYAQVYLRPRILSSDSDFTPIPDAGLPARPNRPSLSSHALVSPWGVNGLKGSTSTEGDVEVQAFTESGGKMYVGGNFRHVQRDAAGAGRVEQSFLAAFDVQTGEWDPTFRPVLNEQVRALATLPDGTVVAAGAFSQANGRPATAIVALDPVTGATRTSWNLTVENRVSGGVLNIRALDLSGGKLYIGGAFSHLSGGTAPSRVVYARSAARVDAATGTPDPAWNPEFNGSVIDLDGADDGARVYAAGYFSTSKGAAASRAAALQTAAGAALDTPAWKPTWSSNSGNYQQAVQQVGNRVFVGGGEHSLFGFDTATFTRQSGNIMKAGGDVQAVETDGELLYASCHCSQWTYSGAYTWSTLNSGWTQADAIKWLGVWDAATGAYVPDFVPNLSMRLGSGPWAIKVDSLGRVWAGGDIETVRTSAGQKFSGGFARFQRTDSTAPAAPAGFRVASETSDSVTFRWDAAPDPSGVTYQVLLDDRPVATTGSGVLTATVPRTTSGRYFVRATDSRGNVGATSRVLVLGAPPVNQDPPAPATTQVAIASGSTWKWYYRSAAPGEGWRTRAFDDSSWSSGAGVLGWGAPAVTTSIDTFADPAERPITAYFRRSFQVTGLSRVVSLRLDAVADDGAVVHVNGVEVGRQNMRDGAVTHTTYAPTARRHSVAAGSPLVIDVPVSLLVEGTNVVSVETHLNYRRTPDLTFDLKATVVTQ